MAMRRPGPAIASGGRSGVTRLMLTDFRSYRAASLEIEPGPVILLGGNGAGKTNLIEAISLLGPGRGLRGAGLPEIPYRMAGQEAPESPAWAVAARLVLEAETLELGTGIETGADAARRTGRRDGATVGLSVLAEHIRLVWLTPAMDRLFLEAPTGRRKFLDRLVLALDPAHAARSAGFERAMRERNRLLRDGPADPLWLEGLEAEMARHGVAIAAARTGMTARLADTLDEPGPFPQPLLDLEGPLETRLKAGESPSGLAGAYAAELARARPRDQAAGRTLQGPHMSDLLVTHRSHGRPAAQCSTGEQKALLISLVLAQTRLIAALAPNACPVLLLDEIGAHLDAGRRAQLFDAICALKLQAWLTGTDGEPFAAFGPRAQRLHVVPGQITPL
jgi:DNA replication and repair protein RecF